jgi:hypothetical protein
MPYYHRFKEHQFSNEISTTSAILSTTPYKPEVLIVGSFNPVDEGCVKPNCADFFYGRSYFWPAILRIKNSILENPPPPGAQRTPENRQPSIDDILSLCDQFKLSFADMVISVDNVLEDFSDVRINAALTAQNAANNTEAIVKYICSHKSIKNVYATSNFNGSLEAIWDSIINGVNECRPNDVVFGSLITPSGNGVRRSFPDLKEQLEPGKVRSADIARHWVWQNELYPSEIIMDGPISSLLKRPFNHFDHEWLAEKGVDIDKI